MVMMVIAFFGLLVFRHASNDCILLLLVLVLFLSLADCFWPFRCFDVESLLGCS